MALWREIPNILSFTSPCAGISLALVAWLGWSRPEAKVSGLGGLPGSLCLPCTACADRDKLLKISSVGFLINSIRSSQALSMLRLTGPRPIHSAWEAGVPFAQPRGQV